MSHTKRYTPDIFGWFLWHIFFICHLIIFKFANKLIVHLKISEPRNVEYNEVFLLICDHQGF